MLMFEMYADVKMNRPVDLEKDYISPGGYAMKMGNKTIHFDFEEYDVYVDRKDNSIIHIEQCNPDYSEFEDLEEVTENLLKRVIDIPEFFIFTGEPGETDLKPVKLLSCTFCLPYEDKRFGIPTSVCRKAVLASNIK